LIRGAVYTASSTTNFSHTTATSFTLLSLAIAAGASLALYRPLLPSLRRINERVLMRIVAIAAMLALCTCAFVYTLRVVGPVRAAVLEHMDVALVPALGYLIHRHRRATVFQGALLALGACLLVVWYDPHLVELAQHRAGVSTALLKLGVKHAPRRRWLPANGAAPEALAGGAGVTDGAPAAALPSRLAVRPRDVGLAFERARAAADEAARAAAEALAPSAPPVLQLPRFPPMPPPPLMVPQFGGFDGDGPPHPTGGADAGDGSGGGDGSGSSSGGGGSRVNGDSSGDNGGNDGAVDFLDGYDELIAAAKKVGGEAGEAVGSASAGGAAQEDGDGSGKKAAPASVVEAEAGAAMAPAADAAAVAPPGDEPGDVSFMAGEEGGNADAAGAAVPAAPALLPAAQPGRRLLELSGDPADSPSAPRRLASGAVAVLVKQAARLRAVLSLHERSSVLLAALLMCGCAWVNNVRRTLEKQLAAETGIGGRRLHALVLTAAALLWTPVAFLRWAYAAVVPLAPGEVSPLDAAARASAAAAGLADSVIDLHSGPSTTWFFVVAAFYAFGVLLMGEHALDMQIQGTGSGGAGGGGGGAGPLLGGGGIAGAQLPALLAGMDASGRAGGGSSAAASADNTLLRVWSALCAFSLAVSLSAGRAAPGAPSQTSSPLLWLGTAVVLAGLAAAGGLDASQAQRLWGSASRGHGGGGGGGIGTSNAAWTADDKLLKSSSSGLGGGGSFSAQARKVLAHILDDDNSRRILMFLSINVRFTPRLSPHAPPPVHFSRLTGFFTLPLLHLHPIPSPFHPSLPLCSWRLRWVSCQIHWA
jgi:uncharacterized membrane protein YgcG